LRFRIVGQYCPRDYKRRPPEEEFEANYLCDTGEGIRIALSLNDTESENNQSMIEAYEDLKPRIY